MRKQACVAANLDVLRLPQKEPPHRHYANPGVRFMLMFCRPYGEQPIFNGPYLD